MNPLFVIAAEVGDMTLTDGGIAAVLITIIGQIVVTWIKERKEKKAAEDPETKKKLAEAEALKGEKLRDALLKDITAQIAPLIDAAILNAQSGVSGLSLNLSERILPVEKRLEGVTEVLQELAAKLRDLYKWHDVDEPLNPGRKVWYSPSAEINELANAISNLGTALNMSTKQVAQLERAFELFMAAATGKAQGSGPR